MSAVASSVLQGVGKEQLGRNVPPNLRDPKSNTQFLALYVQCANGRLAQQETERVPRSLPGRRERIEIQSLRQLGERQEQYVRDVGRSERDLFLGSLDDSR